MSRLTLFSKFIIILLLAAIFLPLFGYGTLSLTILRNILVAIGTIVVLGMFFGAKSAIRKIK